MPNWCSTTYKIVGDDKSVNQLFKDLKLAFSKSEWICDFVEYIGYDPNKYSLRGTFVDMRLEEGVLTIYQETAWSEQAHFRDILHNKYPNLEIYYREEECGLDVYGHNDHTGLYFPEQYVIDCDCDGLEYYDTLEDAIEAVKDITGNNNITTEKEMFKAINEYSESMDVCYSIHRFEIYND